MTKLVLNRGSLPQRPGAGPLYLLITFMVRELWDLPGWIPNLVGDMALGGVVLFFLLVTIASLVQAFREKSVTIEELMKRANR